MRLPIFTKLAACVGVLSLLTACPLEEDFEEVEDCVPGQVRCRQDGRIDNCNEDGVWAPDGDWLCVTGGCMVMENAPVCM